MSKERRESRQDKELVAYNEALKRAKMQAKEDVGRIRPILEKDPNWPLASGQIDWKCQKDINDQRNALSRLTKKAVKLLFPEYKIKCHHGSGTDANWITVDILATKETGKQEAQAIRERAYEMLESSGLQYGSYFPDTGPGADWTPCLLVTLNHFC
jgi:hypothetical protein